MSARREDRQTGPVRVDRILPAVLRAAGLHALAAQLEIDRMRAAEESEREREEAA